MEDRRGLSEQERKKNVFIVGFNEFHRPLLEALPAARECQFHVLLGREELRNPEKIPLRHLLDEAHRQLDLFDGSIDAIWTYWDFPSSCIAPILAAERGLPHVPLDAVLRCEHKYWSRVEQQKVIPQHVPRFCAVDPFDDASLDKVELDFPFWLKPVKSFNSYLGFRIDGREDLAHAIPRIRQEIHHLADPFNYVLGRIDVPPEIRHIDGSHCIAEEIISTGRQCTIEGYEHAGGIQIYGTVDSHRFPGRSTFSRYEYPSTLPESVQQRMVDVSTKVMRHLGFKGGAFNIEFFWEEETDHLWLLEINTRVSQSHSELFAQVDGQANHAVPLDLALGHQPRFPHREGASPCAAKFYVREFQDRLVKHVAPPEEIRRIEEDIPGTRIELLVEPGYRLSDITHQESYSYELAWVYTAGETEADLLRNFDMAVDRLHLEFGPPNGGVGASA